jgi:hypothetical protein
MSEPALHCGQMARVNSRHGGVREITLATTAAYLCLAKSQESRHLTAREVFRSIHQGTQLIFYARPIRALMQLAAHYVTPPYSVYDHVVWLSEHYLKVERSFVGAHIVGVSGGDQYHIKVSGTAELFWELLPESSVPFDPAAEESNVDEDTTAFRAAA